MPRHTDRRDAVGWSAGPGYLVAFGALSGFAIAVPFLQLVWRQRNNEDRVGPPVGCTYQEVEVLIQNAIEARPDEQQPRNLVRELYEHLSEVEDSLVKWRVDLAKQEKLGYVPSQTEIAWLKLSARFFLAYVPFLKCWLSDKKTETAKDVFVSHNSTMDRKAYAAPLKRYLERRNDDHILSVFLASESMVVGEDGRTTMLYHLVNCRMVWVVLSEHFIEREWAMREYLIGCSRHVLEQAEKKRFCLLMDCIENDDSRSKEWSKQVLSMQSLAIFNDKGRRESFPQLEQSSKDPHDIRYETIASKQSTIGGPLIESRSRFLTGADSFGNEVQLHEYFPLETFRESIRSSKKGDTIRLMNTFIANLQELPLETLRERVHAGVHVKILLIAPDSSLVEARDKALDSAGHRSAKERVQMKVEENIDVIRNSIAGGEMQDNAGQVELETYDSLPSFSLYQAGSTAIIGFYFHGGLGISKTQIQVSTGSDLGKESMEEFELVWKIGEKVDLE